MQHFFVDPFQINDKNIVILGDDVNHIKNVLRMKIGEEVSVSNGIDGRDYRCEIESIDDNQVNLKLMFIKEDGVELPVKLVLFQGLPKSDKMELIIQKAVELGVSEIVPVATKRAVVKLDAKKEKSKLARWQAISESAAKQSKRAIVPEVKNVMSMSEAVKYAASFDTSCICYELAEGMNDTKNWIDKVKDIAIDNNEDIEKKAGIFIGPEGGFDENEVKMAFDQSIVPISLGKRILRTETAGMTMLSIVMYELETIQ